MSFPLGGETFSRRVKVTIDKDFIDGNLTDWTGSFDLSALTTADFWNTVKSDGGDIRAALSDGTTRIALELKNFNQGAETGQIYVPISSVSSGADTDFYIYWGNAGLSQPAEDAAYGKEAAWPSKNKTVHHFDQDPSGTPPQAIDSTSNDNDGTSSGSMTTGDLITTSLNWKAWQMDGVDDYVSHDAAEMSASIGTIEIFFKTNFAYNDVGAFHYYVWSLYVSNSDRFFLYYDVNLDKWVVGTGAVMASAVQSFASGTVFHLTVTWDTAGSPEGILYLDGAQVDTTETIPTFTLPSNIDIAVGEFNSIKESESPMEVIDYRHYNTVEAAEWVNANHECLSNQGNFYKAFVYESSIDGSAIAFGANF
jgi:hypothetical protein